MRVGGTLTGEHGIGVEKIAMMPLIFSDDDMTLMRTLRDAFNPHGLCNPGKVLPAGGRGCVEKPFTLRKEQGA